MNITRSDLFRWQAWFYFLNSLLLILVGIKYLMMQPEINGIIPKLFSYLSLAGHFITVAMVPMIVTSLLTIFTKNSRVISFTAITLSTLLLVLIGIDSAIFELYRFHINGMVWGLIIGGGFFEILPISWLTWLMIIAAIAFVIYLQIKIASFVWQWIQTDYRWGKKAFVSAFTLVMSSQVLHAWGDANNQTEITKQVRFLPGFKPVTMKRYLRNQGIAVEAAEQITLPKHNSSLSYPIKAMQCEKPAQTKNILLVTIDSWRFDMLTQDVTPNIWHYVDKSQNFSRHISSGNATRFGIFGMFYGLDGTYWHAFLSEEKSPVLMDVLQQQDYQFSVHPSARLTSPEFDRTVFSKIRNDINLQTKGNSASGRDKQLTEDFLTFLRTRNTERPFFGFLFYDAPHAYEYPESSEAPFQPVLKTINHLALDNDFDPVPYRNKYKNAIHYNDQLIGSVLDELSNQGLLENTIIIFTGDHGEEFNETGQNYWGHNSNFTRFQTQVPLLIYWPGREPAQITHSTSGLDLAPTLLQDALGCSNPASDFSNGHNLFTDKERHYFLVSSWDRFSMVTENNIDVVFNAGTVEHYDLDFNPVSEGIQDMAIMKDVMEKTSRFFSK